MHINVIKPGTKVSSRIICIYHIWSITRTRANRGDGLWRARKTNKVLSCLSINVMDRHQWQWLLSLWWSHDMTVTIIHHHHNHKHCVYWITTTIKILSNIAPTFSSSMLTVKWIGLPSSMKSVASRIVQPVRSCCAAKYLFGKMNKD